MNRPIVIGGITGEVLGIKPINDGITEDISGDKPNSIAGDGGTAPITIVV